MTERDPNHPTDYQPTGDQPAAAAEPVRTTRGGTARWGVALLVTGAIVAIAVAAALLVTGQSAPSSLVGYAPADSFAYGELRLDLPGDQRAKVGQFLSRFPGFKDQANLPGKVDEVFNRIVLAITNNEQDFTNHIKPWFGGEIGFSASAAPSGATPQAEGVRYLILVSVTDASKARAWLDSTFDDVTKTTADHNGTQLVLLGDGPARTASGIHGKVMLVGDEASVRAAIDTNGAGALPKAEKFTSAQGSVSGESLGYLFFDLDRYFDIIAASTATMPPDVVFQFDETYRSLVPDWAIVRLQARGDAIAFEVASPHVDAPVKLTNRVSELAPHLPFSTIFLADMHDLGDSVLRTIELYRANPGTAEAFKQVDQVANLLGGFDAILGWIQDGGVVVTRSGDQVDGGIVFSPKDRAAGERLLTTLRSYAVLGLGQSGLDVTVRDEPYEGTTISVIDLGDWRDIVALAGGQTTTIPFEGRLEIAYATTDEVIVVGLGDSFVKAVLEPKPGQSLADQASYRTWIDQVGAQNVGSVYLAISSVREAFEGIFRTTQPASFADYVQNIQPYLLPLDAYVQSTVIDGKIDRTTGVLVVH
jgi:uncharacterized protein DUF3352